MHTRSRGCLLDTRLDILVLSSLLLEPRRKIELRQELTAAAPAPM